MSRLGKKIIAIPEKTEVSFTSGVFTVKGPQGELSKKFKSDIEFSITDTENGKQITLKPIRDTIATNALWGAYGSIVASMVKGVNELFVKKLILEGIGYKSEIKSLKDGDTMATALTMALGFSHPVNVFIPQTLKVTAEKNIITVSGIDKEEVGRFAANLRALKKPEPYKGKGMRYEGEVIKRKQGKKTA